MARQVPVPLAATSRRRRRAPVPRRHARLLGPLALLLAGTVALPAAAQDRVDGDRYQNPRYGVQIEKPPRWHFITASTVIDVARKAAGMPAASGDATP